MAAAVVATALLFAWPAEPAAAVKGIESFTVSPSSTQAGGHPDLDIGLAIKEPGVSGAAEAASFDLPQGFVANPTAAPDCIAASFSQDECSPDSQVGVITVRAAHEGQPSFLLGTAPVYLLAREDSFGRIGFVMPTVDVPVTGELSLPSATDYGLRIALAGLPEATPLASLEMSLWGVPAGPVNDGDRFPKGSPGSPAGCPGLADTSCAEPTAATVPQSPFLNSPTSGKSLAECTGPLTATATISTHQDPSMTFAQAPMPETTGCHLLSFNPSMQVEIFDRPRSQSGLSLELTNPQELSPTVPAASALKSALLSFEGALLFDQAAAGALAVCSEAQLGLGVEAPAACPPASSIGQVAFQSPLFSGAVSGGLYYGGVDPGGLQLLYLTGSGSGLHFKLVMQLEQNETTEGLAALIASIPQVPISEIDLDVSPSAGVLRTGRRCTTYPVRGFFAPWASQLGLRASKQDVAFTAEPNGMPCPGPATSVEVSLQPSSIFADGQSTTSAVATVTDAEGAPVVGDDVEFESSDPDQQIGSASFSEDGTYSVSVTASNTPGTATITAIDHSVNPPVSSSAVLLQLAPPVPAPPPAVVPAPVAPPPAAAPVTKISRHPPRRSRKRSVSFAFTSTVRGAMFFCSLDRRRYRPCTSPLRLRGLSPGAHRFRVFAVGPSGVKGKPAAFSFRILAGAGKRSLRRARA